MRLLVLSLLLLSLNCFAQEINQTDATGRKQGNWIYYGKDRPELGYPADGKVEEGTYVNDRKEGIWTKYHADGKTPKIIGEYGNNRPMKQYRKFYENGQLKEIGCFEKNQNCDSLKRFYENGQLEYEAYYAGGHISGRVNEYYPNGTLKFTCVYSGSGGISDSYSFTETGIPSHTTSGRSCKWGDEYVISYMPYSDTTKTINQTDKLGRKQGHWIYYGKDRPESGIPADGKVEEGYYVDDRKEGEWIKYLDDGKTPKVKGIYENGRPKGQYVKGIYPSSLQPMELSNFVSNHYVDSLIRFYSNGNREYAAFYDSLGKEQGWVRFYHINGEKEFEYLAINGLPTGTAYRFYVNGDTNEIITYNTEGQINSTIHREPTRVLNPPIAPTDPSNRPPKIYGAPNTKAATWKQNGYNKVFNEGDEIWQDGIFKDGSLYDGKVYYYDRDGILLKVKIFKSGLYHSDGQL